MSSAAMTCTEAARKCDTDHRCRHLRHSLSANCPVAHDQCTKTSLDECRRTILHARATILEQPCYCPLADVECMAHQRTMIPNNPCIEKAMLEYSRIMGYNTPPIVKTASIETNRVYETSLQEAAPAKDPSGYRQEKARIVVDNREILRSGGSGEGDRRVTYGQERQSWKNAEEPPQKNQYKAEHWREEAKPKENNWKERSGPEESKSEKETDWESGSSTRKGAVITENGEGTAAATTTPEPKQTTWSPHRRNHSGHGEGRRKSKHRTTMAPLAPTEPPPPWVTTTTPLPTTTTTFITHAPPPPEGCTAKDASGRQIFVHIGAVIRRYVDWSGRCSSWCECLEEDKLVCERLPCLEDGRCEAPLTSVDFGERLFLRDRGACFCESGTFICDLPEEMPEVYPGLYLLAGYSLTDIEMLRSEIPRDVLERAGFLSANAATDIASRLQIAFERILPKGLQCRIVLMPEMSEPGSAFMRVEWFGKNEALNHTKMQWHTGRAEKACSPYINKLSDYFSLSESPRFQLVLSSVKQLKRHIWAFNVEN
ncbi:GDNF/GAS1 domain protein [Oesophagostomum dentatum]|uniref:GDNF/GAS1 domain protein n=1 Tax=Oesophagostomum dentatum TaxID=61180 RepID=A0A0B1TBK6_OESDE|nr:GDNF/GAS1 domain protein [Oesophagostomum dentatum]